MFSTYGDEIAEYRAGKPLVSDNQNAGVDLEPNSNSRVTDSYEENEKYEGNDNDSGKGDKFGVSDLVWGKVRSHLWWPGQIFDPSDASEKVQNYSKKDGFLIAYFGDKTFEWNEESRIKPFRENFVSMEKQSKTESFCQAVECALGEVSRRVEFGLSCKCMSSEVYDATQNIVNAGIREESSRRESGDRYYSGERFVSLDLVEYVQSLARFQCDEPDRLEFVTSRAQLLAYNRYKGFTELPEFQMFKLVLGDSVKHNSTGNNGDVSLKKEMGIKGCSNKRKQYYSDPTSPGEKGRNMSVKTSKKRKVDNDVTDSMMVEDKKDLSSLVAQNQFSDIGKQICSVIPVLNDGENSSLLGSSRKKPGRKKVIPAELLLSDNILSHLSAVAKSPIKGYSSLRSSISFIFDMRNLSTLEKSSEYEKEFDKTSSKESEEELPKAETVPAPEVEGFEDSYWTDRVVLSNTQEEILFEPGIPNGNTKKPETPHGNGIISAESDPILDPIVETTDHVSDKCDEENPTALILNFSDIDSVPSQQNLNNIFRRYGPLKETSTEVVKKSRRAKVIFKRRSDAETAFSSSGKFSIFGPSLVSYRLNYLPAKQEKSYPVKKRSKKGAKSVEGNDG